MSFWYRQLVQSVTGILETLPEREQEFPEFFDNTDGVGDVKRELFHKDKRSGIMLPYKGRSKPVDVETKIGVEAHITGVSYGTSKRARKFWRKLIDTGELEVWESYGETPEAAAARIALHQRFWTVPYHWVGLLNGDILYNNQITRYTSHGNRGNGPLVGVSLEGNFPGLEKNRKKKHNGYDEHTILTGRGTVRLAVTDSRDRGAPIRLLRAHRQYSGGRVGDPGEGWWKEIGIPMAKELDLEVTHDFKKGSGLAIPQEWDPQGNVNYRGKKL